MKNKKVRHFRKIVSSNEKQNYMLTRLSDNLEMLEHHACFRNWADELRKLSAANITSHLVLTKKSELNLNDKDVFPQAGLYQGGEASPTKFFSTPGKIC